MTTEPGRPPVSSTPTSVVVAKILTVGASAGSMLVLMAAMAVGQQPEASTAPVEPTPAAQPTATVDQVPAPRPTRIGSSVTSRTPQVPRGPVPKRAVPSWSAPRSVPKPAPRSVPTAPRVTPTRPAPTPVPRPVVRPAPPTRTPDATSRAS